MSPCVPERCIQLCARLETLAALLVMMSISMYTTQREQTVNTIAVSLTATCCCIQVHITINRRTSAGVSWEGRSGCLYTHWGTYLVSSCPFAACTVWPWWVKPSLCPQSFLWCISFIWYNSANLCVAHFYTFFLTTWRPHFPWTGRCDLLPTN